MARRMSVLVIFALACLFLAATFVYQAPSRPTTGGQSSSSSSSWYTSTKQKSILPGGQPLKIYVTETGGSHDEVLAGLVNSWGKIPGSELTFFQRMSRYGSHDIMRTFDLVNQIPDPRAMMDFLGWEDPNQPIPDIIISTTCEFDTKQYRKNMTMLLEKHNTYLFCVIHHADRWGLDNHKFLEEILSGWIEKERMEFIALSPHTAEYLVEHSLNKWKVVREGGKKPLVRHFVPIFPVQLPANTQLDSSLSFGLQGDFGQERRDYKMVFSRLGDFLTPGSPPITPEVPKVAVPVTEEQLKNEKHGSVPGIDAAAVPPNTNIGHRRRGQVLTDEESQTQGENGPRNITLHLVGHGKHPPVPDSVKDHVVFDEGLSYIDFYTVLSRCFALLPAFATPEYLDRKASSTVPASLIAGVPLVATQDIVDKYAYLTKDIVWLQGKEETDFDVIGRVLKLSHQERQKKVAAVKAHTTKLINQNTKLARKWTEEALRKIGRKLA